MRLLKTSPCTKTDEERETARLITQGDRTAMKALYELSVGRLAGTCARYIPDEDDLHDVLQDSYVKIFTHMADFEYRGPGSLEAWMQRIVVNEALKFLRGKRVHASLDESAEDIPPYDVPETEDIPLDILHDMIRRLPDGQRTVFNLYACEGKSHKEIARLLHIGESSSASQFSRAKRQLAQWIREYWTLHENKEP